MNEKKKENSALLVEDHYSQDEIEGESTKLNGFLHNNDEKKPSDKMADDSSWDATAFQNQRGSNWKNLKSEGKQVRRVQDIPFNRMDRQNDEEEEEDEYNEEEERISDNNAGESSLNRSKNKSSSPLHDFGQESGTTTTTSTSLLNHATNFSIDDEEENQTSWPFHASPCAIFGGTKKARKQGDNEVFESTDFSDSILDLEGSVQDFCNENFLAETTTNSGGEETKASIPGIQKRKSRRKPAMPFSVENTPDNFLPGTLLNNSAENFAKDLSEKLEPSSMIYKTPAYLPVRKVRTKRRPKNVVPIKLDDTEGSLVTTVNKDDDGKTKKTSSPIQDIPRAPASDAGSDEDMSKLKATANIVAEGKRHEKKMAENVKDGVVPDEGKKKKKKNQQETGLDSRSNIRRSNSESSLGKMKKQGSRMRLLESSMEPIQEKAVANLKKVEKTVATRERRQLSEHQHSSRRIKVDLESKNDSGSEKKISRSKSSRNERDDPIPKGSSNRKTSPEKRVPRRKSHLSSTSGHKSSTKNGTNPRSARSEGVSDRGLSASSRKGEKLLSSSGYDRDRDRENDSRSKMSRTSFSSGRPKPVRAASSRDSMRRGPSRRNLIDRDEQPNKSLTNGRRVRRMKSSDGSEMRSSRSLKISKSSSGDIVNMAMSATRANDDVNSMKDRRRSREAERQQSFRRSKPKELTRQSSSRSARVRPSSSSAKKSPKPRKIPLSNGKARNISKVLKAGKRPTMVDMMDEKNRRLFHSVIMQTTMGINMKDLYEASKKGGGSKSRR